MPPTLPPVAAMPVAFARRIKKKCAIDAMAGVKIRDVPKPQRMENVRMKCQNSTQQHRSATEIQTGYRSVRRPTSTESDANHASKQAYCS